MPADQIELRFGILLLLLLAVTWTLALRVRGGRAAPEPGRALSQGLVYLAVYAACILPPAALLVCIGFLGWQAIEEWFGAFRPSGASHGSRAVRGWLVLGAAAAPWIGYFGSRALRLEAAGLAAIGLAVGVSVAGIRAGRPALIQPILASVATVLALNAFVGLRLLPEGGRLCLFAFFMVNMADTSAYVFGKLFGRHRLAPTISPGKTVEGSIGSLVATVGAGFLFNQVLDLGFASLPLAGLAVALNLLGQAGDLLTSGVKRRVGIKDFGVLIPGHGGVLDRFDSCLLAVPGFLLLVKICR